MDLTDKLLGEVRGLINADPAILAAARARLASVKGAGESFVGFLRAYSSGSIAQLTVIDPVLDADGGIVLDRRSHPTLGPDGDGIGPRAVVEEVRSFVQPRILEEFPGAWLNIGRRSIAVHFPEGVQGHDEQACQYPSVDLIIALTQQDAPGLWIPDNGRDAWDASDPEGHVVLLREGSLALQRTRRRAIRLAKAWARRHSEPPLCSFNLTALALAAVEPDMTVAEALLATFQLGEAALAECLTSDPAGVASEPISCPDRMRASRLMGMAAGHLSRALEQDEDEAAVRDSLASVFGDLVTPAPDTRAAVAAALRGPRVTAAQLGISAATPTIVHPVRSWGRATE